MKYISCDKCKGLPTCELDGNYRRYCKTHNYKFFNPKEEEIK